jgi:hypothetical protein
VSAIFGTEHRELFHPRNGILIHNQIESKFETGLFAIVPDILDDPTVAQVTYPLARTGAQRIQILKIIDRDPAKLHKQDNTGIG